MTERSTRRLAWSLWGTAMAIAVLALVFLILGWSSPPPAGQFAFRGFGILLAVSFGTVGALIASRHPQNAIGWIFCGMGLASGLQELAPQYATYALLTNPGAHLPLARLAAWLDAWIWVPISSGTAYLLLLFPNGHLSSPRWRAVVWHEVLGTSVASIALALTPGPLANFRQISNPFGVGDRGTMVAISGIGQLLYGLGIMLAAVALVGRFRRSRGEEREQLKWLATSGLFLGVMLFGNFVVMSTVAADSPAPPAVVAILVIAGFTSVPVATGIAILRYRLYDIDIVINKAVVLGALAAFISLVYVAIVVGIGALFGRGDRADPLLSILATAVVALAFQPVRERVKRFANRLVYGERATPYEVMTDFSHRIAGTLSVDEVLPQMAEAAARGVGASWSRVRVFLPGGTERSVTWPERSGISYAPSRTIAIVHQGEPAGEISVAKPSGEPITPAEDHLLEDLAAQAGLALRNVRLTLELQEKLDQIAAHAEQLAASRQRLVTARDAQRRQLERDIREGAQGQLLAIEAKLGEAAALVGDDTDSAIELLDALGEEANVALEGLRDLARGIFPPLLADQGVRAALEAHVRKIGATVHLESSPEFGSARFDADTEACAYFCCVQAIQNVRRHAGDALAVVRLSVEDDTVVFEVADEGAGFDAAATPAGMGLRIMQDRVGALEGTLEIRSKPGEGTRVIGRIPARVLSEVSA